ncbi:mersacidin/lichenicidin family type 2 lantibiotic [Vitiosangium sp. GDMCC 1.1324]|uniref:mersacidin/lichenicidin family type 2 lantibiotic n=1 Tax=Vitiosangium sp. (strain GDMCC 1.1324) TaxID=2138576 RepID=UPI000D370836|nr:mersacidin/lichenicidin family type 2 lantibiotic [Vitiosangium sp. GDMCC 1.1324]PTL85890.1 mersacidin/lichenicidin family type 2 lantibiotic [Vitiosangium sp. GDMCC 1.1324]
MNTETLIRAWKDPSFRASLTSDQLRALPENPSGKPMTELGDDELTDAVGGRAPPTTSITTIRWSLSNPCIRPATPVLL